MKGLEQVRAKTMAEAEAQAMVIVEEAEHDARRLLEARKNELRLHREELEAEWQRAADQEEERDRSMNKLANRNAYLASRQAIIADVKDQALEKLEAMEEGERYDYLLALLQRTAQDGDRVILNERDRALFPKLHEASGLKLVLEDFAAPIRGGLILERGERVYDLSFDKYFETKSEEITQEVAQDLWGKLG